VGGVRCDLSSYTLAEKEDLPMVANLLTPHYSPQVISRWPTAVTCAKAQLFSVGRGLGASRIVADYDDYDGNSEERVFRQPFHLPSISGGRELKIKPRAEIA
jgi:hypothetical protein